MSEKSHPHNFAETILINVVPQVVEDGQVTQTLFNQPMAVLARQCEHWEKNPSGQTAQCEEITAFWYGPRHIAEEKLKAGL